MGILPALDSRHRVALPDSPPSLASPTASSFSSRSSPATEQADQAWSHSAPASLPMTNYEKGPAADMSSADTGSEAAQSRPETGNQPSARQQLPSLSSLFGPPSTSRPLGSPSSDRPGSYPAQSPLDRPRASGANGPANSYFSSAASPPVSQPRSTYDVKVEPEKQSLHSLARSFSGSGSPRYRDINHSRPESRSDAEPTGKWSMYQESSRHEYSLGSRDASFRSPRDKFRPHFAAGAEPSSEYGEQRSSHTGPIPPPTPTSTVVSDIVLSKDGLGPKIWTGTHFLPRFVRAAEVPGEGLCYFYDDGSHCKTVIDGEAVNAHWGVTKAGKPRKRLAIACVTCREKKIKCDPDYPRCVQCEKFGRICKFKNAPRGGNNTSPSTPPAELDDVRRLGGPSRSNEMRIHGSDCSSPASPRVALPLPSPDAGYSKRLKVGPDSYVSNGEPSFASPRPLDHSKSQLAPPRLAPEMPRIPDDVLSRAWRTDPYVSDPHSISAVVAQFFAHVDNTMMLRFLPEDAFKSWLASSVHRKSADDLMLLYSMLAVGVTLSGGPKHIAYEYAQVAHYAQKVSTINGLQLIQSRILLAVYYISTSKLSQANEMVSSAASVSACMQLGVEFDKSNEAGLHTFPFGLNRAGYCEARRRTLWSLFLVERLGGLFPGRPPMTNSEDIYARLPADSQSFEKQVDVHMPIFDPRGPSYARLAEQPFETTGYLIEILNIWSDCQSAIHRLVNRPSSSELDTGRFHSLTQRLRDWRSALPSRLAFGGANLDSAAFTGNVGSFLTMHLLYHHATIKLNRHYYLVNRLSHEMLASHVQQCCDHASSILDIVNGLDRILRVRPTILNTPPPAMSMAITEAVDTLSATGPISHLDSLIDNLRVSKTVIDNTANVWEECRGTSHMLDQRVQMLYRIRDRGSRPTGPMDGYRIVMSSEEHQDRKHNYWQIGESMERQYSVDRDAVYFSRG